MALVRVYEGLKRRFGDDAAPPLQCRYVARLRLLLSSVGSWPHRRLGDARWRWRRRCDAALSLYNLLLSALAASLAALGGAYIYQHRHTISFFDVGHELLCICLGVLFLQRLLMARTAKYREVIEDFFLEFHLFYFRSRSLYSAKIHSQIHIISGVIMVYVMCQMACGVVLFIFMPLYNNYSRGMFGADRPPNSTFEHAVYYYLPEEVYTTTTGHWILVAVNVPVSCNTTIGALVFDFLLCLIVLQIWGHLKILKHNLLSLPLPANRLQPDGMYSPEENIQIQQLLKENIVHHSFIIKFTNKCSDAFSEHLLAFYLIMQLITCMLLLEVTSFTADALAKYGSLTIGMHQQLILVSILFEMINTKSEQLIDAVYATPWERMNAGNRRVVQFLLMRVQRPVTLKAAKVVPVGIMTMSVVLKNTWSYYMMLTAVAKDG